MNGTKFPWGRTFGSVFVVISDFIKTNLVNFPHERYQTLKNIAFKPDMFRYPLLSSVEFIALNRFKALKKQIEWLVGRFAVKNWFFLLSLD